MDASCKNCENGLAEVYAYCPSCGQKAELHRLSPHDILHEGIHYFTHADKGFFRLLKDLAVKHGAVAHEYMAGKRRKYFPPLNFFFICAAIYVFAGSFDVAEKEAAVHRYPEKIMSIADKTERERNMAIWDRKQKADVFMDKYSNYVAMAALPFNAFIFFLFYRKAGYTYTEHLVAHMFMIGFTLLAFSVSVMPLSHLTGAPDWLSFLIFVPFQVVYFAIFYKRFLRKQAFWGGFKAFAASLATVFLWTALSWTLVGLYIANGFFGLIT